MTLETNKHFNKCYIGIGSNLSNPLLQVTTAIEQLQQLSNCEWLQASSLYRSAPVGPPGQDDYINAVACLNTSLKPEALLDALQHIENTHQRLRKERWGARTLDLDILLFGEQVIATQRLNIPHQHLRERNFVLIPLAEIAPDLTIQHISIDEILRTCPHGALEKISTETGPTL